MEDTGISTRLDMHDNMSSTLNTIGSTLNSATVAFAATQQAFEQGMDTRNLGVVQDQLESALQTQEDLNNSIQNMDASGAAREYSRLNITINNTDRALRENIESQEQFNSRVNDGVRSAGNLKRMLAGVVGVLSVRSAANFIQRSIGFTNENIRLEQKLSNAMANRGATYEEFVRLQEHANRIQADTNDLINSTTMLGAANELAQHVGDLEAIEIMMSSLADFAAGRGNIFGATAQDMAAYAEYFTQAMAGNYRMLERRAGIHLNEMQRDIIMYGDDMQRALLISDIVSASWGGLAEQMSRTPEGMQASMRNMFNDIQSRIGAQLLPMVMMIFTTIKSNMPLIEAALQRLVPAFQFIINLIVQIINMAFRVAQIFSDNWGVIAPILAMIAAGFVIWKIATIAQTIAQIKLNIAMLKMLLPIALIVIALFGLIAIVRHFSDSATSALGIIMGAFAVLGAFIWNAVTGVLNAIIQFMWTRFIEPWISIIEWVLNVFNGGFDSFGYAVRNLLANITGWFLSLGTVVTRIIDAIFGTNWTDGLNQLRRDILRVGQNDNAITISRENPFSINRISYEDAWNAGYALGSDIESRFNIAGERGYPATHTDFVNLMFDGNYGFGSIGRDVSDIAGYAGDIANISGENLRYWRDIAERDTINRFTTAKVSVRIPSITNTINNNMDLDDVVDYIVGGVSESLEVAADRSYSHV